MRFGRMVSAAAIALSVSFAGAGMVEASPSNEPRGQAPGGLSGCDSENTPPVGYAFLHRFQDDVLPTACEQCASGVIALREWAPEIRAYCWEFKTGVAYLYYDGPALGRQRR